MAYFKFGLKGNMAECVCGFRVRVTSGTAQERIRRHECDEHELVYRYAKARGYV